MADIMLKAGDILLIWNYPHIIGSTLIKLFSGARCDHCAGLHFIFLDGKFHPLFQFQRI